MLDLRDKIISVKENLNDTEFLKSVTGVDDLSGDKLRSALDSIYINGKNLTDTLSEEEQYDISAYAKAVRNALNVENNSFVTIMKKNSIFADPKAVIPDIDDSEEIIPIADREKYDRKTGIARRYIAGYRRKRNEAVSDCQNELDSKRNENAHIFFDRLFYNEDGTLKDPQKDPAQMSYSDLTSNAAGQFDHLIPNFIITRTPENLVYAYMMTKEYPEGSGKALTYEQLFDDNSEDMRKFKEKSGREFFDIFSADKNGNNAEKFNNVAYPVVLKMTNTFLQQKVGYHDINDLDDMHGTLMTSNKVNFLNDLFQQFSHVGNLNHVMAKVASPLYLDDIIYKFRLDYIKSDLYSDNSPINAACDANPNLANAIKTQAVIDIQNIKAILEAPIGCMEGECEKRLMNQVGRIGTFYLSGGEAEKYRNGLENECVKEFEKPEHKKEFGRIERNAIKVAQNPPKDPIAHNIEEGAGAYKAVIKDDGFDIMLPIDNDNLQKFARGKYTNLGGNKLKDCYGMQKGLLYELTGCLYTERDPMPATNEDKKMLMNAVNNVMINGVTMADRFQLNENNIIEDIALAERKLANIMLNNDGTDMICVKTGRNTICSANVTLNMPMARSFNSQEDYEKAVEKFEMNKKNTEVSNAYAKLHNCLADDSELNNCENMLRENGVKLPGRHLSAKAAEDIFGKSPKDRVLPQLIGRNFNDNNELTEAAKNVYIGNRTLAELCPVNAELSTKENMEAMGRLLSETMNRNMHSDNEYTPVLFKNKYGNIESVRLDMEKPVRPKPVELFSGVKAFFMRAAAEENKKEYDKYVAAENRYINDSEQYSRFSKYNEAVERARRSIVRTEMGEEPTRVAISLDQAVHQSGHTHSNTVENTLTRPQPTNQHTAQNNGIAVH